MAMNLMPMPVGQIGNSVPMPVGQIGNSVPMSRSQGPLYPWIYSLFLGQNCNSLGLVLDLSDHTDCCGSECKLFHLGAFPLIHLV